MRGNRAAAWHVGDVVSGSVVAEGLCGGDVWEIVVLDAPDS
jgi:hypothetical protein